MAATRAKWVSVTASRTPICIVSSVAFVHALAVPGCS
jgi:hypothetical protein